MVGRRTSRVDRGVSSVIAVVLIVAVTVLLAATASYVVFGMGGDTETETAPQVTVSATYDAQTSGDGQTLTLEFESGDSLDERNVSLELEGAVVAYSTGVDQPTELKGNQIESQIGQEITPGDTLVINQTTTTDSGGAHLDLSEATLRLVWNPGSGDSQESETIWSWSA